MKLQSSIMQVSDNMYSESCGLLLLAAGASERLGEPKQLLQVKGKSLIQHVVETTLQVVQFPIIVLGANAELIKLELTDKPVDLILNSAWKEGMASSIRAGVKALVDKNALVESVIIMVCDQPFVTATLLNEMIAIHAESNKGIVACRYEETLGTPVLFSKKYFAQLQSLAGNEGAKKILFENEGDVSSIAFALGNIDIDTMEDYNALLEIHK